MFGNTQTTPTSKLQQMFQVNLSVINVAADRVLELIKEGADVNCYVQNQPLLRHIFENYQLITLPSTIIETLLNNGANIDCLLENDRYDKKKFHTNVDSVLTKNKELKDIVDTHVNKQAKTKKLLQCITNQDSKLSLDSVKKLVNDGADVNAEIDGTTIFAKCCFLYMNAQTMTSSHLYMKIIELLLQKGADVNKGGMPPPQQQQGFGLPPQRQQYGMPPQQRQGLGMPPQQGSGFGLPPQQGSGNIKTDYKDPKTTPLYHAVMKSDTALVKLLLQYGVDSARCLKDEDGDYFKEIESILTTNINKIGDVLKDAELQLRDNSSGRHHNSNTQQNWLDSRQQGYADPQKIPFADVIAQNRLHNKINDSSDSDNDDEENDDEENDDKGEGSNYINPFGNVPQHRYSLSTYENFQQTRLDDLLLAQCLPSSDIMLCKTLINAGANINVKNGFDATPLNLALSANNKELILFLLKNGATIDCLFDKNSQTYDRVTANLFKKYPDLQSIIEDHIATTKTSIPIINNDLSSNKLGGLDAALNKPTTLDQAIAALQKNDIVQNIVKSESLLGKYCVDYAWKNLNKEQPHDTISQRKELTELLEETKNNAQKIIETKYRSQELKPKQYLGLGLELKQVEGGWRVLSTREWSNNANLVGKTIASFDDKKITDIIGFRNSLKYGKSCQIVFTDGCSVKIKPTLIDAKTDEQGKISLAKFGEESIITNKERKDLAGQIQRGQIQQ